MKKSIEEIEKEIAQNEEAMAKTLAERNAVISVPFSVSIPPCPLLEAFFLILESFYSSNISRLYIVLSNILCIV